MSLGTDPRQAMRRNGQERRPGPQTVTQREWKRLNLTDSRLGVAADELAWLENAMLVGKSPQSVPLFNSNKGPLLGAGGTPKRVWGGAITIPGQTFPHNIGLVVYADGSAWQRDFFHDPPVDTNIAGAGTFASGVQITNWRDGPVLLLDPVAGYYKWTGAALVLIDATKTGGTAIASFEGRVFMVLGARTLTYTAPNTYDDFTALNGAGTFTITDEVFQGAITHLHSSVEQLWIFGATALDALGNVATTGGVTTFSVTNVTATLGSSAPNSVVAEYRSLFFYTGYSLHAVLGVTPQKLSGALERLLPLLTAPTGVFGTVDPWAATTTLNGVSVTVFLFTYTDPATSTARAELLCYHDGKWFLARPPALSGAGTVVALFSLGGLVASASSTVTAPEVYGVDSLGYIYRLFARPTDPMTGTWTISGGLADLGAPIAGHQGVRFGTDWAAPGATGLSAITMTVVSEKGAVVLGAAPVNFFPAVDAPLGDRYALDGRNVALLGQRLGWTLQGPCADRVRLEAVHLDALPTGEWDRVNAPAPASSGGYGGSPYGASYGS